MHLFHFLWLLLTRCGHIGGIRNRLFKTFLGTLLTLAVVAGRWVHLGCSPLTRFSSIQIESPLSLLAHCKDKHLQKKTWKYWLYHYLQAMHLLSLGSLWKRSLHFWGLQNMNWLRTQGSLTKTIFKTLVLSVFLFYVFLPLKLDPNWSSHCYVVLFFRMWWQQVHLLYTLNVCSVVPEGEQLWFFLCRPFWSSTRVPLTKTSEVDAGKVISMGKKTNKKLVVSLDVHIFSALGTLQVSDLGGLVKFWTDRFLVRLPWPALWFSKLLTVEFATWWLLQPSQIP